MATRYYNIAGATSVTTTLFNGAEIPNAKSLLITNTHSTNAATITLFIQQKTATTTKNFKITNLLSLPSKVSFLVDEVSLLKIPQDSSLQITVGSSDTVDVLINV